MPVLGEIIVFLGRSRWGVTGSGVTGTLTTDVICLNPTHCDCDCVGK